ncbi:sigma-54-dependent Fis family transcriptional regulator [Sedimentibacter hydroxybenzoicus DSM 7310]|uniref:Sigma-54-dependent Fis family transcriptional regulator n=1 Tax=Sedimentibacter hydroxybenzoicus DSM 7310 TaxID=1123245 RepID=A0A974GWF2_SEDHY|nr:sigma-54 dependent transcriptional regulator [Sedimentibacter hydroxybenzoicus]NYB73990.1 sigma-54-dependent Fis family transcriptional regulator [Sedimentibacter hydroxybenzoicus DSM 7310]
MEINLLIVDDEKSIRETLKVILSDLNYKVFTAKDGYEATEILNNNIVDILITDLRMPGMDGIELMKNALEIDPFIETIFISAYADIKSAVKAVKMGAVDYIEKSFSNDELIFAIERAIEHRILKEENRNLKRRVECKYEYEGVVGKSEVMQKVFDIVNRVANSRASILLTGESGVGKEVIAKLIHNLSCRKNNSFVVINCGAIPENLIESELFGFEKGSFTGADHIQKGKFELANGGTLFLDEIGELPFQSQVKFLRALQEKQIYKIGSEKSINVDVRIIAATNKNLPEEVKNGNFREDLFYRLNVINIEIPPLRERKDDISSLAEFFMEQYSNEYNKKIKYYDPVAIKYLIEYEWKGNVRELSNVIERSVLIAHEEEEFLLPEYLPKEITGFTYNALSEERKEKKLSDYEKMIILSTLNRFNGNKTMAAKVLGIKRQTLYNKIKYYNIEEC